MLRIFGLLLLLVAFALPVSGWWIAQRSLPVLDGVVTISDLYRPVTIKFDDRAVPYIQAQSDNDAYFAQGYITAAQRMFQMDMLRRQAKGELSQIYGGSCVSHDRLMRTVGISRLAAVDFKNLPKEVKDSLQAYTRGVNAYLFESRNKLSLPFTLLAYTPGQWEETDSLAILKYMQYQADESWQLDDLRQRVLDKIGSKQASDMFAAGGAQVTSNGATSGVTGEIWQKFSREISSSFFSGVVQTTLPIWGSNAWVVGKQMSESNGALLACDKHSLFTAPDIWYLSSLSAPNLHIAGATVPGVPGILLGRNNDVAWAATAFKADGQDLVLEQFSPQFPNQYKTPSGWLTVTEISEDIPIRFNKALVQKLLITKDGPILTRAGDSAVVLAWAAANNKPTVLETYWRLNRAESADDVLKVIASYAGSPQSFVYADAKGSSGFHVAGVVPLHGGQTGKGVPLLGSYGTTALPGWTADQHWPSRLAFDQLPGAKDTPTFAVANPPFTLNTESPYRWARINSLLSAVHSKQQKVGLPDMAFLQADQYGSLASLVKSELQKATTHTEIIDKYQLAAAQILDKWDGNLKPESVAASIYESFIHTLARRLLEPKIGLAMTLEYMERWPRWSSFVGQILATKPKEWLPPEERTYETFIITTFAESIKNVRLAANIDDPNKWPWQSLHRASFQDEMLGNISLYKLLVTPLIGPPTLGLGGDADSINACNIEDQADPWLFASNSGPTDRLLVDMSDRDKFYVNTVLGQSEHLLSPYRLDQLHGWLRAEPVPLAFSPAEEDKQMQHKLILTNQ